MYEDEFGCILCPFRARWATGVIEPVSSFDAAREWIEEKANPDGYVHPPRTHMVTENRDGSITPIPKTERHAFLWTPPATHRLTVPDASPGNETRRGLGGFLIHFAGFLHGYRSQFTAWSIDGRLAARPLTDLVFLHESEIDRCFDVAVGSWSSWSPESHRVITNALYFHNRVPMYEWDWERFQAEYQVMDALYAVARDELGTPRVRHHERLTTLCDRFGIQTDAAAFADIAQYRNALIHQVVWGEGMPGEGFVEGYRKGQLLRHINRRLGLAVLGISAAYVRSSWAALLGNALDMDP